MIILSDKQIENLKEYMKSQKEVVALYLYGSYGTKYQTPLSDVEFYKEYDKGMQEELL